MSRNRRSARQAGARFERQIADYLAATIDDRIDRRVKTGAKDRGDLANVRMSPALRSGRVVCELKDVARVDLPGWTREAETERLNDDAAVGLVIHKRRNVRDPAQQWVSMTLADLVALLTGSRPDDDD